MAIPHDPACVCAATGAIHRSSPGWRTYPWLILGWLAHVSIMLLALLVAIWWPVGALVVAAVSGTIVGVAMGVWAPTVYADWA